MNRKDINLINETMKNVMTSKYIIVDLYSGRSEELPQEEFKEATRGLKKVVGDVTVYKGEEYIVLVLPN